MAAGHSLNQKIFFHYKKTPSFGMYEHIDIWILKLTITAPSPFTYR